MKESIVIVIHFIQTIRHCPSLWDKVYTYEHDLVGLAQFDSKRSLYSFSQYLLSTVVGAGLVKQKALLTRAYALLREKNNHIKPIYNTSDFS